MNRGLCDGCKRIQDDLVHEDELGRRYCVKCYTRMPVPSEVIGLNFLAVSVPFDVGDVVKCWTGGHDVEGSEYDGVGHVVKVSFDIKDGGTPVYPIFHVKIDEKASPQGRDEGFYTEACLRKSEASV